MVLGHQHEQPKESLGFGLLCLIFVVSSPHIHRPTAYASLRFSKFGVAPLFPHPHAP